MDVLDEAPASSTEFAAPAGRIRKRRFSSARIQPTRIKKVMQSDEEIGRMVASVPVALGSAMEHFAEKLLECAAQCVQYSSARTLTPSHIRYAILKNRHFQFLDELTKEVPMLRMPGEAELPEHVAIAGTSAQTLSPVPRSLPKQEPSVSPLNSFTLASQPSYDLNQQLISHSVPTSLPCPSYVPLSASSTEQPQKRKRGRPRKEKKDKYMDPSDAAAANGHPDADRALMPPPAIPISGRTRRTAFIPEAPGSSPPLNPPSLTAL